VPWPRREPGAARPAPPDAAGDGPETKVERAELERLKEEVDARQKAVAEASKELARKMQELAKARRPGGPAGRSGPVEFQFQLPKPVPGMFAADNVKMFVRPDQDRRIAELEEKLEKLQDEVKALKKEDSAKK
jgi:DNA repair exonuclease SbcCD ATPase subunit